MKKFTKKTIILGSVALFCLVFLIYMLIFPLGYFCNCYYAYIAYDKRITDHPNEIVKVSNAIALDRTGVGPFTFGDGVNIPQVVVFSITAIAFIVLTVLFLLELKRTNIIRPTKAERLQQQVDDLQKQIDKLKKGE